MPLVDGLYPSFGAGALDDMRQHDEGDMIECLRKVYPGATDEQLRENAAVLRRYMELMWRMYQREKGWQDGGSDEGATPLGPAGR